MLNKVYTYNFTNLCNSLKIISFNRTSVNQRYNGSFDSRYKLTAKELDNQTGFTYFSERYYDSELSIWLSVDPMAEKRSWVSPYVYCQNNLVGRVDPTGALDTNNDDYIINRSGEITQVDNTGGSSYDVLWEEDYYNGGGRGYDYLGSGNGGIRIDDTEFIPGIREVKSEAVQDRIQGYYSKINGNQAINVCEFLADACSSPEINGVEWSILGTTEGEWAIGTLRKSSKGFMFSRLSEYSDFSKHAYRSHSHGGAFDFSFIVSGPDYQSAKTVRKHNPNAKFSVYMPELTMENYNNVMRGRYYNKGGRLIQYPLMTSEPNSKFKTF